MHITIFWKLKIIAYCEKKNLQRIQISKGLQSEAEAGVPTADNKRNAVTCGNTWMKC